MKDLYNQKREQGFTIIEVMIVLAIAAVILLIVLLAVPALQRNSRNTSRNNDAAQFAAAVNTCLANNNGDPSKCQSVGTANVDVATDSSGNLTRMGQLTNPPVYSNTMGSGWTINKIYWGFQFNCNGNSPAGNSASNPVSTRAFVVMFQIETSSGTTDRCVSS